MKKSIILVFLFVVLFAACEESFVENNNIENESNNVYNDSSDFSQSDTTNVSDVSENSGDQNVSFVAEDTFYPQIIYHEGTYDSDLVYYSKFGNIVYTRAVIKHNDGKIVEGSFKFVDGEKTVFYPGVTQIIEYQGEAYGVYRTFDAYIDAERYYVKLDDEQPHEKLFQCWDITYFDNKVYYNEYETLYSLDIEGKNKCIDSLQHVPIYKSGDVLIYVNDDFSKILSKGENESLFLDKSESLKFINNNYAYYLKIEEKSSNTTNKFALWRKNIDSGVSEKLFVTEEEEQAPSCAIFAGKLLIFSPQGIFYVFEDNFSAPTVYNYGEDEYGHVAQICATADELAIMTVKSSENGMVYATTVYDTSGEIVFEYDGQI